MKFTPTLSLFSLLSSAVALDSNGNGLHDDILFSWNTVKMPFAVSDVMANYMQGENGDEDAFILITGGCDSEKGNERADFGEGDLFACFSTSSKTLRFDPFANTFQEMASMPHERQRHGAAAVGGILYVVGGRDSNDELVTAVDAYNPNTNVWTTVGQLSNDVVTSDLTAWAWKDSYLYVTGGFQADYTAVGNTYRLDVPGDLGDDSETVLSVEQLATSPHPRGDYHGIELYGYAYLAGGISHASDWCEALTTTERYHMETDTWETLGALQVGRADMAMASMNGKIIAMGGETKPEDCRDLPDPAYGSVPASHVDVLDPQTLKWIQYEKFADKRFRFAAAVVPAQNRLYTFGGQLPHDFTCDCFPTTDDIGIGTETFVANDNDDGMSAGAIAGLVIAAAIGALVGCFIAYKCTKSQTDTTIREDAGLEKEDAGMTT